jgi:MoaD family protein
MVEVLYFAGIRDITQKDREICDLEQKKLRDLVQWLINKYAPLKEVLWDEDNQFFRGCISIAINHTIIRDNDPLSFELHEGDKVAFLTPVSGG